MTTSCKDNASHPTVRLCNLTYRALSRRAYKSVHRRQKRSYLRQLRRCSHRQEADRAADLPRRFAAPASQAIERDSVFPEEPLALLGPAIRQHSARSEERRVGKE